MKIAIPLTDGKLSAHFGHCQQFAIIDADDATKVIGAQTLIKETGVFVANLVTESMRDTFTYLSSHSGRNEDKLGLPSSEDGKVHAPILLDSPISIECTVTGSIVDGSHEMFIGRVEYVHPYKALVDSEGHIDFSRADFLKV